MRNEWPAWSAEIGEDGNWYPVDPSTWPKAPDYGIKQTAILYASGYSTIEVTIEKPTPGGFQFTLVPEFRDGLIQHGWTPPDNVEIPKHDPYSEAHQEDDT